MKSSACPACGSVSPAIHHLGTRLGPSVIVGKEDGVTELEGTGRPPGRYPETFCGDAPTDRLHFAPACHLPSGPDFREALHLSLTRVAEAPEAVALVDAVQPLIEPHVSRGRTNRRGPVGTVKLRHAVAAIVGGILHRWASSEPRMTFRSRTAAAFTGSPVGARQFVVVTDSLIAAGLVAHREGISYEAEGWEKDDPKTSARLAGRYWPTDALLRLAEASGLHPDNVADAFRSVPPTTLPVVKHAVEMRVLDLKRGTRGAKRQLPVAVEDAAAVSTRAEVEAHNAMAARWAVTGCCPPRWRRLFIGGWTLHGRWYAAGTDGAYQTMPERERIAAIRMNGEAVAEIDIKSCHLSILAALSGQPLPPGADPYDVPGVLRPVVKRWIVATLGKGSPMVRVPKGAGRIFAEHHPRDVARAVVAKHPVLADPAALVPAATVERHGDARRVLPHWLAGIEAEALTDAMRALREGHGVLSLPMHDGLIVPRSAVAVARVALTEAFERLAGFTPGLTVEGSS